MTYVWRSILILWLGIMPQTGWGTEGASPSDAEIRKSLQSILMDCDRDNGIAVSSHEEAIFFAAEPEQVLSVFREFEQDQSSCKRDYAYSMEWEILQKKPVSDLHQQLFERLIHAICTETDENNAWQFYGLVKVSLTDVDFTETTKNDIRQHLATAHPHPAVILLAGIANLTDQIPRLTALRMSEEVYAEFVDKGDIGGPLRYDVGWDARLALARMGSQEDIRFCIEKIEATQDMDIRIGVLLPYYGYIQQPDTIRLLQQYLESDKRLAGTIYGRYALPILRESLEGFPIEGGVKQARSWMRAQKSFRYKR